MNIIKTLILSLLFSTPCFAFTKAGDEFKAIESLLQRTESQRATQMRLQELMQQLQDEQVAFIQGSGDKAQAAKMVELGDQILHLIEQNNYNDLFPLAYLEELRLFSKMAQKKGPAKP